MKFSKRHIIRIASVPIVAVLFLLLFFPKNSNEVFQYEIGKPWTYDFLVAGRSFPIYKTDRQLTKEREDVIAKFVPYFIFDSSFLSSSLYVLSADDKERLENNHRDKIFVVRGKTASLCSLQKIHTPRSAYEIVKKELSPNLKYDSTTSERILHNRLSQISTTQGMVQVGEKIIDKGEIVTEEKYQQLYSYFKDKTEHTSYGERMLKILGIYGLITILITLFLMYLYTFRPQYYSNLRDIIFLAVLCLLLCAIASFSIRAYALLEYVVPFVWIPIVAHAFYDSRTALFLHLMNVMLVSCIVPHPFMFVIMQIIAGMVVIVSLRNLTRSSQLIQTATWVSISYFLTYTLTTFIMYSANNINPYVYLLFILNGVLIICAYGIIYLFERVFKKTSDITLVELADLNSAVLLKLAEKAPGTFQHSLQVSTLATACARSIDANFLLIRTAALYHDIGKITTPWFFTENQRNGYNPLLEKSITQAVNIIKEHVVHGLAFIKENHLPPSIIPFVKTHHGTSVIRYFYNEAVNKEKQLNNGQQNVNIDDFRYPGPKPQTKEEAILMMADAIEARSRSLKEFTHEKINEVVNETINSQMQDNQFSDTNLSFKDIATLRKVFVERLLSMHHIRIEYPKINNQATINDKYTTPNQ